MNDFLQGHEKRRHVRVPLAFDPGYRPSQPARAEVDLSGRRDTVLLMDVSEGGVGLLCERAYDRGAEVVVIFRVGSKAEARDHSVRASGVVRFCAPCSDGKGFRVGVEFLRIDRESSDRLRRYIADLLRS